ncbi:MAG TPA: DUF3570 domain-containing protein [Usitatibacteraceae bacterium]|nr:DUF3570 domain-containing protein [Usitatibacteraceae bacterium]
MAADRKPASLGALLAAASALPIAIHAVDTRAQVFADELVPGVLPAEAAIGVRSLWYKETGERMTVREPVGWFRSPVGETWELSGSATLDTVSGASATQVSNGSGTPVQIRSGASITERRTASEWKVRRKFGEHSLALSRAVSNEKDYQSRAWGATATLDFNDRNTTLTLAGGQAGDRIGSTDDPSLDKRRRTRELLVGITQLLDRHALVQSNLQATRGSGYFSDPYRSTLSFYRDGRFPPLVRLVDARPDTRDQLAWLTRFKRNFSAAAGVFSGEYRYFRDSWGIRAHTFSAAWLQSLGSTWKVEPALRFHSQGRADFYRTEITERPAPAITSSDQRLAAFGALEPSVRLVMKLTPGAEIDLSIGHYRQQGNWRLGGRGSPHFEPLAARLINAGFVQRF